MSTPALELQALSVGYRGRGGTALVLHDVSLTVGEGETYGLVGESGCGKSTAALAALRALPRNAVVRGGRVLVAGQDLAALDGAGLRQLRRTRVSMVYQDPGRALNPSLTVAQQLGEAYRLLGASRADAAARAEAMLRTVRIASPARVMAAFPHQLSGGMQQRVVIAMALAKNPALLVLDEPTTGLDATVEAEVLDLLGSLQREFGTAILFISHNLAVIGRVCDRVGVLYAGRLVEEGPAAALLQRPMHPYTVRLLRCLPTGRRKADGPLDTIGGFLPPPGSETAGCIFAPRCDLADAPCRTVPPPVHREGDQAAACHHTDRPVPRPERGEAAGYATGAVALRATGLGKTFAAVRAVCDVSLSLRAGETLGLVGESGSGKTTLARLLLGLLAPDPGGAVELAGQAVAATARGRSRAALAALQVVFQNPDSALNRAHTVRHLVGRPLGGRGGLDAALAAVRLDPRVLPMRPRQLSGGLKQRVAIARAFAGDPAVVICDEPTSALDVSVQAAILNLLAALQAQRGVAYILISHDLGVVRYLADRIAVLYLGRLMEVGPADAVFDGPHHPYTEALLSALPGATRIALHGEMPSAADPPGGCVFHTRCHRKIGAVCETAVPVLDPAAPHAIACHLDWAEMGQHAPAPTHGKADQEGRPASDS